MHYLLKHICDARFGRVVLNIKSHMPVTVNLSSRIFRCPMISMDYLDCISGNDATDRINARVEFIKTHFFINNCNMCVKNKSNEKMPSFAKIAENCKAFKDGLTCWGKLASELLRSNDR